MEERKMRPRPRRSRRKVCKFCVEKATGIDYKDIKKLTGFISETGKIMPRRMSGVCASAPSISAIWLSPSSAPA